VSESLRQLALIADNAIKDLLDEWVLSLCIVLSLAAIIAPLLILFGLKQGVIESIREQLVNDPVYREITPKASLTFADSFFQNLESDSRTELVIPSFTMSASMVQLELDQNRKSRNIEIHPTAADDPLIVENAGIIPSTGQVTITSALADKYQLAEGDTISLLVGRKLKGRRQNATIDVTVNSVLSARASRHEGIYARDVLVSDIEKFRLGQTVNREGWPAGRSTRPAPMIDGVLFNCTGKLPESLLQRVLARTDFSVTSTPAPEAIIPVVGRVTASEKQWHLLETVGGGTSSDALKSVRGELRGNGCGDYSTWVNPLDIRIENVDYKLIGLPESRAMLVELDSDLKNDQLSFREQAKLAVAPDSDLHIGDIYQANFESATGKIVFPVEIVAGTEGITGTQLLAPMTMLERLRATNSREAIYDSSTGNLRLTQVGYSGFRIYAKTIDDVPSLARKITELGGVDVVAKTDDIVRIQLLNKGLAKIVLIIAIVGLLGGSGALVASLTASVERKLAQMGQYRLLGFRHTAVAGFPVVQGCILILLAILLAGTLYVIFSQVIQTFLNQTTLVSASGAEIDYLQLRPVQYSLFVLCVFVLAIACSAFAARRTLSADPAEALRQE